MTSALRLDARLRWALYAAFTVLFATGVGWLFADPLKDSANGDRWQQVAADLLMIHGGATMVTLILLGALIPTHVLRAWPSRHNRVFGTVLATANAVLVVTAFGLYYAGSDLLRFWISDAHIAVGLIFPALLVVHIVLGRRSTREPAAQRDQPRSRM
jgi:cytochrome b561